MSEVSPPDPAPPAADAAPAVSAPPRWVRIARWVAAAAVASPFVAYFLKDAVTDGDATLGTVLMMATTSAALLAAALWVLFLSGWPKLGRAAALLAAAAGLAALFGLFRVEVDGAMMITGFRPRFGETAETRALAFAEENRVDVTPSAGGDADGPASLTLAPGDWPGLLGPRRDGRVLGAAVSADWSATPPRVLYRHPVSPGWGGFAVVGDRRFTLEQRGDEETVVCYLAGEPGEVWATGYDARFGRIAPNGGDGPASTPLFHDGAIYSCGATGVVTRCDALTGELAWRRELLTGENIQWGLACSPLVAGGNLVVLPGAAAGGGSAAVGLDPETGETVWSGGDSPGSYSSPVVAEIGGVRQILAFEGLGLRGLDLAGETLWDIPWTNQPQVNAAVPIAAGDGVFLSSGYGTGSAVYRIEPPEDDGDGWEAREQWTTPNRFKLKFNDAVLHGGHLYGLDEGILSCVEFATGTRKWKRGRYGYGQCLLLGPDTPSPVLLVTCEDGDVVLVAPSPDRGGGRELARYSDAAGETLLTGTCWNHPAFRDGRLYWRNGKEAVCVELPTAATAGEEIAATR